MCLHKNEFDEVPYACYPMKLVKAETTYERVDWPTSKENDLCSIEFNVNSVNPRRFYYTRSWKYPSYCRQFMKDWNRFAREKKTVCISARLSDQKTADGKKIIEQYGPWEVIRIGKWCRSYFGGGCD